MANWENAGVEWSIHRACGKSFQNRQGSEYGPRFLENISKNVKSHGI